MYKPGEGDTTFSTKLGTSSYLQMLHEYHGIDTARRLINLPQPSEGFIFLLEHGRLDLTVEALVLQPGCRELFADEPDLLERARQRLINNGFNA